MSTPEIQVVVRHGSITDIDEEATPRTLAQPMVGVNARVESCFARGLFSASFLSSLAGGSLVSYSMTLEDGVAADVCRTSGVISIVFGMALSCWYRKEIKG